MSRSAVIAVLLAVFAAHASALFSSKSAVEQLTAKNFKEKVLNSDEPWLVEFYAPWCGHCKNLAPVYEQVAKNVKGLVRIGAIDADAERGIGTEYSIKGFPTIKYFPPEKKKNPYNKKDTMKTPEDYNGPRSAKAIADYILSKLTTKFITKVSSKNSDTFLQKYPELSKVLLFTNKSPTTNLYKALSGQFKGRLSFGEVKHTEKELVGKYNVTSFPTLLVVKTDSEVEVFDGKLSHSTIHSFLEKYASEKKIEVEEDAPKKKEKKSKKEKAEKAEEPTAAVNFAEVHEIKSQAAFSEVCNDKGGLCVIALLPDVETEAEREKYLDIFREVAKKKAAGGLFRFLWLNGPSQRAFADSFRLASEFPQLIMVSPKKLRYLNYLGAFQTADIVEFLDKIGLGTARTIPYTADEIAPIVDTSGSAPAADKASESGSKEAETGKSEEKSSEKAEEKPAEKSEEKPAEKSEDKPKAGEKDEL